MIGFVSLYFFFSDCSQYCNIYFILIYLKERKKNERRAKTREEKKQSKLKMAAPNTLKGAIHGQPNATAVIIPTAKPGGAFLTVTYAGLVAEVSKFQAKLAAIGITQGSAVSIATVNSYEFIVSFLAASWQRGIAAPLNPNYKQDEFEFYIEDVKSAIVLVPRGAFAAGSPAVKAAKRFNAAVAECYWDAQKAEVALDVKDLGQLKGRGGQKVLEPQPEDTALVLHTRSVWKPPSHINLTGLDADEETTPQWNNISAQGGTLVTSKDQTVATLISLIS